MSFDHGERNGSRNDCVNGENLEKIHEHVPLPRRTGFIKMNFLVGRPMKSLIAIDGSDRA